MIPTSFISWILFLILTHIMLMTPEAWPLVVVCTLMLLSNTLNLTCRQDHIFKSTKLKESSELETQSDINKHKLANAIKEINKISSHEIKVYILKGNDPNAYANPIKEQNQIVFGITEAGIKEWSEKELISVMAHELAHISYNHASKTVWLQLSLELTLYIVLLLSSASLNLLATIFKIGPEYGWLVIAPIVFTIAPCGLQILKKRVQCMEHEADLYSASHFTVESIVSALQKIKSNTKQQTHPDLSSRIDVLTDNTSINL